MEPTDGRLEYEHEKIYNLFGLALKRHFKAKVCTSARLDTQYMQQPSNVHLLWIIHRLSIIYSLFIPSDVLVFTVYVIFTDSYSSNRKDKILMPVKFMKPTNGVVTYSNLMIWLNLDWTEREIDYLLWKPRPARDRKYLCRSHRGYGHPEWIRQNSATLDWFHPAWKASSQVLGFRPVVPFQWSTLTKRQRIIITTRIINNQR